MGKNWMYEIEYYDKKQEKWVEFESCTNKCIDYFTFKIDKFCDSHFDETELFDLLKVKEQSYTYDDDNDIICYKINLDILDNYDPYEINDYVASNFIFNYKRFVKLYDEKYRIVLICDG